MENHRSGSGCGHADFSSHGTSGSRPVQQQLVEPFAFFKNQWIHPWPERWIAAPSVACNSVSVAVWSASCFFKFQPSQEITTPAVIPAESTPSNKVVESESAVENSVSKESPVSTDVSAASFHIVGGCFRKLSNAELFIEELRAKGIDASNDGTNAAGLIVVSVFSSNNKQQVIDALPEFKSSVDSSVWVMEKK